MSRVSDLALIGALVSAQIRLHLAVLELPGSDAAIIRESGGAAALARDLHKIPPGKKLPPRGSADRLAYDATRQQMTRLGKGRGRWPVGLRRRLLGKLRRAAFAARRAALARGGRSRMVAHTRISSPGPNPSHGSIDSRTRTIPAGGLGVLIHPRWMRPMLDAYDAGDLEEVGAQWASGFANGDDGSSWLFLEDPDEYDVLEIKLWADGEREP